MQKLQNYIKTKSLTRSLRDISVLGIGNLAALIITAAGYPLLSRLYTDSQFGEFAFFQSVFSITLYLATLNYPEAIMVIKSETRLRYLVNSIFLIVLTFVLLLSVFISLSGFSIIGLSLSPEYQWILPLIVILGSIVQLGNFIMLKGKHFNLSAIVKVVDRAFFLLSSVFFSFIQIAYNGLILGMLISQISATTVILSTNKFGLSRKFSLKYAKAILYKYRSFPLFSLPGGMLERISRHLPILLISYYIGDAVTGQYAMAYKILSIPEMIVGITIGQIFYQRISKRFLSQQNLKPLIYKVWILQGAIGIVPLMAVLIFGKEIFTLVLGYSWEEAGEIAQILSLLILAMFISTPTSFTLTILKKQHVGLIFNIITLALRAVSLALGLTFFDLKTTLVLYVSIEILLIIVYNIVVLKFVTSWERNRKI